MVPLPLPGSSSFSIARCLKASCSDTALSVDGASVVTGGGFTVYVWATHGLNWADNAAVAVRLASAGATLSIAAGSSPVSYASIARFTVSRTCGQPARREEK